MACFILCTEVDKKAAGISWFNRLTTNVAMPNPPMVEGIRIFKIVIIEIPETPKNPPKITIMEEIGLAMVPCKAAITERDNGRSGRMPTSLETSAITGSME